MTRLFASLLVISSLVGCEAGGSRPFNDGGPNGRRVDTGDTSVSATVWEPGDPIPGWDDYDCGTPQDASYAELTMSNVTYATVGVGGPGDGTITRRSGHIALADCATSPDPTCATYSNGWGSNGFSYVMVYFADGPDGSYLSNAQGPYLHEGDHYQYNYGETELQYWQSWGETDYDTARTGFCISRMRPDQLSGILEVYPRLWYWGTADYLQFYRDFRVRIPFTVSFGDHSAELADEPTDSHTEPAGADRVHYAYGGLTYDEAWPWDDITDPAIRDAVYERYTPWNTP